MLQVRRGTGLLRATVSVELPNPSIGEIDAGSWNLDRDLNEIKAVCPRPGKWFPPGPAVRAS